jgi:hypothetical protein
MQVIYEGKALNLEKRVLDKLVEDLKKKMDLEMLYNLLVESGWLGAAISYEQLDEVIAWVEQNAVGEVRWCDNRVAFAESKDYEWFKLKW